ncbi:MAG TPA: hypothetical protein VE863_06620 [Pyrinomonadaceae bacterium]|nr:hypothetical protein [Pyrinomonadaceae bacterium]
MTGKLFRSGSTNARPRWLASFLLFTLACGTVAEFTHTHSDRASQPVSNVEVRTFDSVAANVLLSESTTTSSRSKSAAECLICQLHQNLSNSTVTHTLATGPTETHSFTASAEVSFHRADFSTNRRGRAPPTIL